MKKNNKTDSFLILKQYNSPPVNYFRPRFIFNLALGKVNSLYNITKTVAVGLRAYVQNEF